MEKRRISSLIVTLSLVVAAASLTAKAASGGLRARIPFDFVVKGKVLPAGDYTVEEVGRNSSGVLLLREADGKAQMFVAPQTFESAGPSPDSRLVFHRYGDQYYLSAIHSIGSTIGMKLPTSAQENRLAKMTAQVDCSVVTVAANPR